jgi:hypothetical protein
MHDSPGGAPRKFKTPDELTKKFTDYMKQCKKSMDFANIAGFCVFCDMTRETYYTYKNNYKEYSDAIKKIELELENYTLSNTAMHPTLKIFYMKNKFSDQYRDKIEYDVTSNNEININLVNNDD